MPPDPTTRDDTLRRKVFQTDFGAKSGNCWSACLASLLNLPIEDVPNFCGDAAATAAAENRRPDWMSPAQKWLARRGLGFVSMCVDGSGAFPVLPDTVCILNGKSPRGAHLHAVVGGIKCHNGAIHFEFIHDPHPSGDFIEGAPTSIDFLVPVTFHIKRPEGVATGDKPRRDFIGDALLKSAQSHDSTRGLEGAEQNLIDAVGAFLDARQSSVSADLARLRVVHRAYLAQKQAFTNHIRGVVRDESVRDPWANNPAATPQPHPGAC